MPIKNSTPAEIASMKARLAERQAARRLDMDCMQAVRIVADKRQREASQQPQQVTQPAPKSDWGANALAASVVAAASIGLGACGLLPIGYALGTAAVAGAGAYVAVHG